MSQGQKHVNICWVQQLRDIGLAKVCQANQITNTMAICMLFDEFAIFRSGKQIQWKLLQRWGGVTEILG